MKSSTESWGNPITLVIADDHPVVREGLAAIFKSESDNGRSNKEIAQILYVSEHTAKAHVRSIMTKLNADSRSEVIAIAIRYGLIKAVPG